MANTRRTIRDPQTSDGLPITYATEAHGSQPPPGSEGADAPITTTQGPEVPITAEGTNPIQMVVHGRDPLETTLQ